MVGQMCMCVSSESTSHVPLSAEVEHIRSDTNDPCLIVRLCVNKNN